MHDCERDMLRHECKVCRWGRVAVALACGRDMQVTGKCFCGTLRGLRLALESGPLNFRRESESGRPCSSTPTVLSRVLQYSHAIRCWDLLAQAPRLLCRPAGRMSMRITPPVPRASQLVHQRRHLSLVLERFKIVATPSCRSACACACACACA